MIAFVIHDAVCSGDTVMFANSFEEWLANYVKKHGYAVFEKRGEIDSGEEFGRIYQMHWKAKDGDRPADFDALKKMYAEKGWEIGEPNYVDAYTVTTELELNFGG